MKVREAWQRHIVALLDEALSRNGPVIEDIAIAITAAVLGGRQVHAFGSGHSLALVREMHRRAGGVKFVRPIWNEELLCGKDTARLENLPGYYRKLTSDLTWGSGDVCWVLSNSGRNALVVELALEARRNGVTVVAVSSLTHCGAVAAAPGLPKLPEIADYVLDNLGVTGDAALTLDGLPDPVAPTSTIVGAALVHAVWAEVAARLVACGHVPPVWGSANR